MDKQLRATSAARAFDSLLPMPADLFHQLFNTLNDRLGEQPCDHSLRVTEAFLEESDIDADAVIEWLAEHGGICDCEVIANVEEHFLE